MALIPKKDAMAVLLNDQSNILGFLNKHSYTLLYDKIDLKFCNDPKLDLTDSKIITRLSKLKFVELWETEYEPELVRVKFTLTNNPDLPRLTLENSQFIKNMYLLINNISKREWVDFDQHVSNDCHHFDKVLIEENDLGTAVILIGAICYCN